MTYEVPVLLRDPSHHWRASSQQARGRCPQQCVHLDTSPGKFRNSNWRDFSLNVLITYPKHSCWWNESSRAAHVRDGDYSSLKKEVPELATGNSGDSELSHSRSCARGRGLEGSKVPHSTETETLGSDPFRGSSGTAGIRMQFIRAPDKSLTWLLHIFSLVLGYIFKHLRKCSLPRSQRG